MQPARLRPAGALPAAVVCAALLAAEGTCLAQPPEPAAVGRDRPLTSSWLCENERSVLINTHPARPSKQSWLTYAGTRVAVERVRGTSDVVLASGDGRVAWQEQGDTATLQFAELLSGTLVCRRQVSRPK